MTTPTLAWHFLSESRQLGYNDGRTVEAGQTYSQPDMDRAPKLCEYGMHGSVRPLDALHYAPGPIICRVEVSGDVLQGDDKIVGRHRRVLWVADATETLRAFARTCALDVIDLWDAPEIVRRYLETGDESIRAAARDAARAAAWNAAWNAARAAARAAARDAAWNAAWNAARAAARDAAWNAAWNAARDAARDAARAAAWNAARDAARAAARAATWDAARAAAWDAQNTRLEQMLLELGPKEGGENE